MGAPFALEARCERASISPGKTSLWAAIRIDPRGKQLEDQRAPLAVALVLDVSGSMKGDPIAHVVKSCEVVAELLGEADQLAIVTFADQARVRCGLTAMDAPGRAQLVASLREIAADGGTNMHAGIATAAAMLASAPAGLRRALVVLSDGQPNRGPASTAELAAFVHALRPLGVSALGFGLHHDENVLQAVAEAGSGRYAYVPDPIVARVELARAALAQGGIVADQLELELRPSEGVELVQIVPPVALRHAGSGVRAAIGDVFVDEGRTVALELAVDLKRGEIGAVRLTGRAPDGTLHEVTARLAVDLHAGPHAIDRAAQRDILLVRADAARMAARAQADRGALPAAASMLREMIRAIDASAGFDAADGSQLAEMREQLLDEAANYSRRSSDAERMHQRKSAVAYTAGTTPMSLGQRHPAPGFFVDQEGRRYRLYTTTYIGRSQYNEIPIRHGSLSRKHAMVLYLDGKFMLNDLGSTNGCVVNGERLVYRRYELADGDVIRMGDIELRFEAEKK